MGTQEETGVDGRMSPIRRIFLLLLALSVCAILLMMLMLSKFPLTLLLEHPVVTRGQQAAVGRPLTTKEVSSYLSITPHKKLKMEKNVLDYDIVSTNETGTNLTFALWVNKTGTSQLLCVGNATGSEVEDIACLPEFKYVPSLKNPCWYSDATGANSTSAQSPDTSATPGRKSWRLRCLPYFYVLGCAKCSTTDLYLRLAEHPDVLKNSGAYGKEVLWWAWRKYGFNGYLERTPEGFEKYLSYFDAPAAVIEKSLHEGSPRAEQLIMGDGSPPDFWDFRGWPQIPQNRGLKEPRVLTPHLMQHVYPDPRFILLFRNPTDRLYSDFFFLRQGRNSYDFHKAVVVSMAILRDCERENSRLWCFTDKDVYRKLRTRIHFGCYWVFLREWLKVFPAEKFLFLRTEDYASDVPGHLNLVYRFLGLEPLPEERLRKVVGMDRQRVTKDKQRAGPMLAKTRHLLNKFYRSCNQDLATMLQDRRFLWP